jgi:AmiR/NasT family two-component response regulator
MRRLRILVADDESIIRMGLRTMLTELGHDVRLAADGREALSLMRTTSFDLALLDVQMPLTNGLEVAKVIARKQPMPVLILTAYSDPDLIERAAQLPIQGYLIKPVDERDLAAAIEVAVARFEEAQAAGREKAELAAELETRKVVERAKGVLMEAGQSEDEAYQSLRRRARATRLTLRQVAEAVLVEKNAAPEKSENR